MKPERQAYFAISGEALLELIKKRKSDLPKDAELVTLLIDTDNPDFIDRVNVARFIITSESFPVVNEGEALIRLDVRMEK